MKLLLRRRVERATSQPSVTTVLELEPDVFDEVDAQDELVATIALRGLNLTYRLIGEIDLAERDEQDPARLSVLFGLDHLANRLRHLSEGLLLLSGQGVPRGREGAMSLADVAHAAAGGSRDYRRVHIDPMPSCALIAGAADDTVLLLAQLLDNALGLSPDATPVRIGAHRVSGGIALQVEDQGLGLSFDRIRELNAQLAAAPVLGVEATRHMGLYVVALLAHRLRAFVQLQPRHGGGTVALVVIPGHLVTEAPSTTEAPASAPTTQVHGVNGDRWGRAPAPGQAEGKTAYGLPRRTRTQQVNPQRPEHHSTTFSSSRPADPEAVRRDISDYEDGVRRARQASGGSQ